MSISTHFFAGRLKRPLLFQLLGLLVVAFWFPQPCSAANDTPWVVEWKTKIMFNSHTSYEFGNPFSPFQAPLSRLEYPMNSIWTGASVRRDLDRFSVGIEYLSTAANQYSGQMKDSDWDDDTTPKRLSVYSASATRMHPSFQLSADVDMQVRDWLHLPPAVDLRPVVGLRWQQLRFTMHDGAQYEYATDGSISQTDMLPGDVLRFKQNWYHLFTGLRLGYTWDNPPLLHRIKLNSQWDWSYVQGRDKDDHLLRGDRVTRDDTVGHAWHAMVGVAFGLTEQLDLGVEVERLRIRTAGWHRHIDTTNSIYLD